MSSFSDSKTEQLGDAATVKDRGSAKQSRLAGPDEKKQCSGRPPRPKHAPQKGQPAKVRWAAKHGVDKKKPDPSPEPKKSDRQGSRASQGAKAIADSLKDADAKEKGDEDAKREKKEEAEEARAEKAEAEVAGIMRRPPPLPSRGSTWMSGSFDLIRPYTFQEKIATVGKYACGYLLGTAAFSCAVNYLPWKYSLPLTIGLTAASYYGVKSAILSYRGYDAHTIAQDARSALYNPGLKFNFGTFMLGKVIGLTSILNPVKVVGRVHIIDHPAVDVIRADERLIGQRVVKAVEDKPLLTRCVVQNYETGVSLTQVVAHDLVDQSASKLSATEFNTALVSALRTVQSVPALKLRSQDYAPLTACTSDMVKILCATNFACRTTYVESFPKNESPAVSLRSMVMVTGLVMAAFLLIDLTEMSRSKLSQLTRLRVP